tara:strand:+ start:10928 stop:11917 length:990 start_codon:yes stop_codon:yes gene_type:complete
MIYKSYLVEQNIGILKNKLTLIYGENLGLQNDLKKKIIEFYKKSKILKFEQDDMLKSNQIYYTELNNKSLFEEKKIILINNCNDKILEIVQDSIDVIEDNKVFIFSNILEKKSKIRNYFEKQKYLDIVPCYKDNEIDIKRTISNELRNFKGFNQEIVNLISENTINDRIKLTNEIEKIKNYFNNISLNINDLNKLLNLREDEDFNNIKDFALAGNVKKTNSLLDICFMEDEKSIFYLALLNTRLFKLKEISLKKNKNLETALNEIKPPIFWKDKPMFITQAKAWSEDKIIKALKKTYDTETMIKSSYNIKKKTLLKKLLIDICNLANAA